MFNNYLKLILIYMGYLLKYWAQVPQSSVEECSLSVFYCCGVICLCLNFCNILKLSSRFKKTADVMLPFCEQEKEVTSGLFTKNYSSSAEFFCFVGVVSFLMQVVLIPAYVFITPVFAKDSLASKLVSSFHPYID